MGLFSLFFLTSTETTIPKHTSLTSIFFNFLILCLILLEDQCSIFYKYVLSQLNPKHIKQKMSVLLTRTIMYEEKVCELSVCFINSLLGGIQNIRLETIILLSVSWLSKRILKFIKANLLLCTTG